MKLRTLIVACICCCVTTAWGQITFSPAVANFGAVYQGAAATFDITLNNGTGKDLVVEDINFFHTDAFTLLDTAFTIATGGSRTLTIGCDPGHNINYADWLLVKSSSHPEIPHARMFAMGKYTETYYDATQNLSNEALKASLKTIVTTGMINTNSYNQSRDQMYMVIDNQRVNGQGATVNTLECVYTGFLAIGYTSRTDAQNTFGLNTEHTMPQSLFSSNLPELSDLHHIFVTTGASNTERANKPFGTVNNPTWTQGGSKSNSSLFEPRDEQKGPSIRALLYFYFRYQDYQSFICNMEPTLRAWNNLYPPTAVDKKRNDDVYAFQHNRNPFVDHPEFLNRIASLCTVDNGDPSPIAEWIGDTLQFGQVAVGSSLDGYYAIANQGENAMTLSNLSLSSPEFTFIGSPVLTVPKDSIVQIPVRFTPTVANQNYSAQLTFNTDAPGTATRTVVLQGNSFTVGLPSTFTDGHILLFPNPASDRVTIRLEDVRHGKGQLSVWNLGGQLLRTMGIHAGQASVQMPLSGLPAGMYLLHVQLGDRQFIEKLIVE